MFTWREKESRWRTRVMSVSVEPRRSRMSVRSVCAQMSAQQMRYRTQRGRQGDDRGQDLARRNTAPSGNCDCSDLINHGASTSCVRSMSKRSTSDACPTGRGNGSVTRALGLNPCVKLTGSFARTAARENIRTQSLWAMNRRSPSIEKSTAYRKRSSAVPTHRIRSCSYTVFSICRS